MIDVDGLKMNSVRLMPGVKAAEFRSRLQALDLLRETPPARELRGRKAYRLASSQIDGQLANDVGRMKAKRGWRSLAKPVIEPGI